MRAEILGVEAPHQPANLVMKMVCAWCGLESEVGSGPGDSQAPISHGICSRCREQFRGPKTYHLQELLDQLPGQILLVDGHFNILAANEAAHLHLGTDPSIPNTPVGDAIECKNARAPGGCGSTVACKVCAIRNAVMETHRSGASFERVPALADVEGPDGIRHVQYHISTEKLGDTVFLRIDEVKPVANF
jgi:hypothetical protein